MKRRKEIALAFPRGAHQEVFIEGILKYVHEQGCQWSFIVAPERNAVSLLDLVGWTGDGVIAALNTPQEAQCARRFPLPIINISSVLPESPTPRTIVDNSTIGVMGAEHLLDRGFQHYAFYGVRSVQYSADRFAGFNERLRAAGYEAIQLALAATFRVKGNGWLRQHRRLTEWLATIPVPCGLLAVSDARARQVIDACNELGLRVPEQVAVLGVDDQPIICEHCHPTISSIARNNIQEGYQAAMLLDRLLQGEQVSASDHLVAPFGITARQSTATVAVGDERLREALDYFQENLEEPVSVAEICLHVGVSRRWLEYAFRRSLGESPFNYIRRQRLEHARRLLAEEPPLKVQHVARRTGYASANQLAKAFRREFGASPRDYRNSLK